jgi:hypothetical protein
LPDESVRIAVAEAVHDSGDGCGDFEDVGVTTVNYRHRQGVRGEENNDVVAFLRRELLEGGLNALGNGLWIERYGMSDRGWEK